MQDVNVVVLFASRGEATERLALAAAVGAVQGRAKIRLRCLEAAADREFVAPRGSDVEWADAILAVMPAESDDAAHALELYFDSLPALREMLRVGRATAAAISEPDALTAARLQGRSVAEAARSKRTRD
ncbi:MAG: hypothetical protein ABSB15_13180 [Bryobacteraceae bacterium]|jgi:hypothetical protein